MRYLRLIRAFIRSSAQQDLAFRANFWIGLMNSALNVGIGLVGMGVIFGQVKTIRGWDYPAALALLGVYLVASALRGLFIGPGLEALAGLGQEVMTGNFDFTLLRPIDTQFLVTFRYWRLLSALDLLAGSGVIGMAVVRSGQALSPGPLIGFFAGLCLAVVILYAILLVFASLTFWSPGAQFTWVFDALFQMARYPVTIYPGWLRFLLTWAIPVGMMTTVPAQLLTGRASQFSLVGSGILAVVLLTGASFLFRRGLGRYASASS